MESQIAQMFRVMDQYYEKVTEETFRKDLGEKQKAILLLDADGLIKGFSTILQTSLTSGGRSFIALYSGDTVLEKEYWGNGALATAFVFYLVEVKLRQPFTPVYWFLISKGYKTYLLMANNFPTHYPRYEQATPPALQKIMDCFYFQRFGNAYNADEGLIRFENNKASYVRGQVAEINADGRRNPRISYFEKSNPHWMQGVELACVAKVSLWMPIRYFIKQGLKAFSRKEKNLSIAVRKNS